MIVLLPVIQGIIRRRMLVNFRVDPDVLQRQLPSPFRPKLLGPAAIAGICLIRLEQLRPRRAPAFVGLASENAAHRIAVCWTDAEGGEREGVYIPRRDSNSIVHRLVGGRLFPGSHERAHFAVHEDDDLIDLTMRSIDRTAEVRVRGRIAPALPATSRFATLEDASTFFEAGATGYSPRRHGTTMDGLYLKTTTWHVEPLQIEEVFSSYFADAQKFPLGSVEFDCALLMRNVASEWLPLPQLVARPTD